MQRLKGEKVGKVGNRFSVVTLSVISSSMLINPFRVTCGGSARVTVWLLTSGSRYKLGDWRGCH